MVNVQFRVDRHVNDVSGTFSRIFKPCDQAFLFEHPPTPQKATHIHGYLFNVSIQVPSFRKNVKEAFSMKPNDYEVSDKCGESKQPLDMSGAYAYGSKFDTIAPSFIKNISPDLLEDLRMYARELGKTIQSARESRKDVKKVKIIDKAKEDLYSIVEQVEKEFDEEHKQHVKYIKHLKCEGCSCGPEGHFRQICYILMKVLQKRRKRFNSYDFERYVYPIWTKKFEDAQCLFIDSLWKKYSSN